MKEHCRGEAGDSSRRNRDIEEQETGVELVSKLPQIVSIANYAQGAASAKGELYSTALNPPRGNDILLYAIAGVPSAWAANISLQIQAIPQRLVLFFFFSAPHLPFLTIAFFSHKLKRKRTADHATVFPSLKTAPHEFSPRHLSLSLSLPCPPTFPTFWGHNVEIQRPKVRFFFSFFALNKSPRLSPC